jgi:uncharacterized protein YjbI with pentapeptide repeats
MSDITAQELLQLFALGERNFSDLDLSGIDLAEAELPRINLNRTNLTGAKLICADLTSASLREANLTGANFKGADLTSAYLTYANLTSADLRRAYLWNARLDYANLTRIDLTGANLTGTQIINAYFEEPQITNLPNMDKTVLIGTNFEGLNVSNKICSCFATTQYAFYRYTILPDGRTIEGPWCG